MHRQNNVKRFCLPLQTAWRRESARCSARHAALKSALTALNGLRMMSAIRSLSEAEPTLRKYRGQFIRDG